MMPAGMGDLLNAMRVDQDGWQVPPDGWGSAEAAANEPPPEPKGPPRATVDAIRKLPIVKVRRASRK